MAKTLLDESLLVITVLANTNENDISDTELGDRTSVRKIWKAIK